jgi:hypothetical protein
MPYDPTGDHRFVHDRIGDNAFGTVKQETIVMYTFNQKIIPMHTIEQETIPMYTINQETFLYVHERAGDNAQQRAGGEATFREQGSRYHLLMQRLFAVELRLAAGPDVIAAQLFTQLMTSLVHWFTMSARTCAQPPSS